MIDNDWFVTVAMVGIAIVSGAVSFALISVGIGIIGGIVGGC